MLFDDAMDSFVEGVSSLKMTPKTIDNAECNSSSIAGATRPPHYPATKQVKCEGSSSKSTPIPTDLASKATHTPTFISKYSFKMPTMRKYGDHKPPNEENYRLCSADCEIEEGHAQKHLILPKSLGKICQTSDNVKNHGSSEILDSVNVNSFPNKGLTVEFSNPLSQSKSGTNYCLSPQGSFYSATNCTEAKQSFTNTEVSECASSLGKSIESGEINNSFELVDGRKTSSINRASIGSDASDESSSSGFSTALYKPHKANDVRWEAIQAVRSRGGGSLELRNFRIFKRLGCGDIGSVHLAELIGTRTLFAMKVMDKEALAGRKKVLRAQTEREILQCLDHPFLPTLYTHFETEKFSFLVMEFCSGGDLHALRQKQPGKFFPEHAARFYLAEVLLALEYLHMLGIIYRDLKPENVLVREDGHIMLSDFDLSLRCSVSPTLVKSPNPDSKGPSSSGYCIQPACLRPPSCVVQPACFGPSFWAKPKRDRKPKRNAEIQSQVSPLPELIAEPTNARSMSFVGTHEYLAPEIIKGEGHGSAVDWWTFGIFLYELLFGRTPFKGSGNRTTLFNVVGQPLRFPETPTVSFAARDLIRGLLVKEPQHRLAYRRGATEIKQHPFFQSVNWALIRCASPPELPPPFVMGQDVGRSGPAKGVGVGVDVKPCENYYEIDFF